MQNVIINGKVNMGYSLLVDPMNYLLFPTFYVKYPTRNRIYIND